MANATGSPLAGKRVVVTRTLEQSELLSRELEARGATVRLVPLIRFAPPEDPAPFDAALRALAKFDWLLLTSQNVVRAIVDRCKSFSLSFPPERMPRHIAAVGLATAAAAEKAGMKVDHIARGQRGFALAEELAPQLLNCAVLLARSDRANPDLPEALRQIGASVTEVVAYRTLPLAGAAERILDEIVRGEIDAVLFFSPSAANHLVEKIGKDRLRQVSARVTCVAIGPVTASAFRAAGVERIIVSQQASVSGILEALSQCWSQEMQLGVKLG